MALAAAGGVVALRWGKTGRFLGVPYDFRPPTLARVRERWWNRDDQRILTPHTFGWGWSINLREVARRLGVSGA
ncbi:MAG: hypothetical protein HY329_27355 [Chloroflexi bacterium]|nr:hypothetical protein [Chloroflexota bacterium]